MKDYKLFVGDFCPYCKKVENFLKENNVDIEIVNINKDREQMRKLVLEGGKRQVPCLYHDGKYLYESSDIIEFVKENM